MVKKVLSGVLLVFLLCFPTQASFLDVMKEALGTVTVKTAAEGRIDLGLKEALNVGIRNSIARLGKENGYFADRAVKILLPAEVQKTEKVLRAAGFGPELDEFILSMNRAAEKAAPLAAGLFADAITDMSFDDAQKILRGSNTAATDYLKSKTYDKLLTLFEPAVQKTMGEYQVVRQYNEIAGKLQSIPLVGKAINPDMGNYVSAKALDGLFYMLAKEEAQIRTNPEARVTQLLKEVFK